MAIAGPNGGGKTTLVRLICGLLTPTGGSIRFFDHDSEIENDQVVRNIGLVGPYLQFYKDLTVWENLSFFANARFGKVDRPRILELLDSFGLKGRQHDPLKTYSSGMLQRVKYVAALYHAPEMLILDEPTSNLDEKGKQRVYEIIASQRKNGIVLIATNEPEEIALAGERVDVA